MCLLLFRNKYITNTLIILNLLIYMVNIDRYYAYKQMLFGTLSEFFFFKSLKGSWKKKRTLSVENKCPKNNF